MSAAATGNPTMSLCRLEDVSEEAARLTYAVGEGDRGEALVYRQAASGQYGLLAAEPLGLHPCPGSGWRAAKGSHASRPCRSSITAVTWLRKPSSYVACSPALDDMLAPEELSSFVLARLKQQAEAALGEPVTGAVSPLLLLL